MIILYIILIVIAVSVVSVITSYVLYKKSNQLTIPPTVMQSIITPTTTITQPIITVRNMNVEDTTAKIKIMSNINVEDTTSEIKIVTTPAPTTGGNFIMDPTVTTLTPTVGIDVTTIAEVGIISTINTMPTETYPLLITYNTNNINMFLNIDFNVDPPFKFSELYPVSNLLQYSMDSNDIFIDNLYLKYENKMLVLSQKTQYKDNHIMKNFYGILYLNSDIYLQNMLVINNSEFTFAPNINMYFELIDISTITIPNRFIIKCNGIDKLIYIDNILNITNINSMNTFNKKQIDTTKYVLSFETKFIKFDTSINKFIFTQDEKNASVFTNNKYLLLNNTFILYDKENQLRTTSELNGINIVKWYNYD